MYKTWANKPEDPNKQKEHKKNISDVLKKAYVPPSNPEFGPVFTRGEWEKEFKDKLNKKMYHLYHGPSELGKSMAIAHALKGRVGVVHLVLREETPTTVLSALARALHIPDCNDVMGEFRVAAREFLETTKTKVVVIVEDIHSIPGPLSVEVRSFLGKLVDLHNDGLINVVFTVSDFSAVSLLRGVSGHSSRLSASPFPSIDDATLANLLQELAIKATVEQQEAILNTQMTHYERLKELAKKPLDWTWIKQGPNTRKDFILVFPKEKAEKIVAKLNSHMGDTTKCLRAVVEDGKSVDVAVEEVVKQAEPSLADSLLGESCGTVDQLTYIATVHLLYEALADAESVDWYTVVHNTAKDIDQAEVREAVKQLVSNNLLSYVDSFTVSAHSRRLKWAYKNVCGRPAIQARIKKALADYKKEQ
jgi:hypothetical protein